MFDWEMPPMVAKPETRPHGLARSPVVLVAFSSGCCVMCGGLLLYAGEWFAGLLALALGFGGIWAADRLEGQE